MQVQTICILAIKAMPVAVIVAAGRWEMYLRLTGNLLVIALLVLCSGVIARMTRRR